MKKISLLLLTLLFVFLQVDAQRTYALLAGVSNYNAENVNNLSNTTKDVKEMQAVFKSKGQSLLQLRVSMLLQRIS